MKVFLYDYHSLSIQNTEVIKAVRIYLFIIILNLISTIAIGQSSIDECFSSFRIEDPESFCGDFTTTGSSISEDAAPTCWPTGAVSHDIWLNFRASRQSGSITLLRPSGQDVPLSDISVIVYGGRCNTLNEVECSSFVGSNSASEVFLTSLTIGATYYIRIDSRNDDTGSFRLCTQFFNPVPQAEQDCPESVILCDTSRFVVEFLTGAGRNQDEADDTCLDTDPRTGTDDGNSEDRSAWYSWTCKDPGTLFFTLTPNNTEDPTEDLDFALFRLPNGLQDCSDKDLLRCMASGETLNQSFEQNLPCLGATGLRPTSRDIEESRGCDFDDDNFLSPIIMEEGESYALLVNNFSSSDLGFSIEFGGTGTFLGPEPEFEIDILANASLRCDQEVIFRDQSTGNTDPIVSWSWSFGIGATPSTIDGQGPHRVQYNSFGTKTAVLTVVTDRGCLLTYFEEVEVDPCCPPMTSIAINPITRDVICNGENTGRIDIDATGGNGEYLYSFDNGDFLSIQSYNNLEANSYNIAVSDAKGCVADIIENIEQPPPVTVDAGMDQTIDLGTETEIMASFGPDSDQITLEWQPIEGLSCSSCDNPTVIALGTTTYTVIATNQLGCMASDEVTINTVVNRDEQVYAPDVFTPNDDSTNDFFRIFAGIAVSSIRDFSVYNRWGELIFESDSLAMDNNQQVGWNGTYRDKLLTSGVFAWQADVLFLDNIAKTYKGTVTLIR